jgi:hypothetical protein
MKTVKHKLSGLWRSTASILPGIGIALLPKAVCPVCWPLYAGLLSALGLGFLMDAAYLLPLTILLLGIAVFALGFRASSRRGYGPFALGLVAAAVVVIGKFKFDSDPATYGGVVLLVATSFWSLWPKRALPLAACPSCVSDTLSSTQSSTRKEKLVMATKHKVEVFSAGCSVCDEALSLVKNLVCHECEVTVLDMKDTNVAKRAKSLGVRSVPAVVIDGALANCCVGGTVNEQALRAQLA